MCNVKVVDVKKGRMSGQAISDGLVHCAADNGLL